MSRKINGLQEQAEMSYDEFLTYNRTDEICVITDSSTVVNPKEISSITGTGTEVTVVVASSVSLIPGSEVIIRDTASYDGRFTVTVVDSTTQFRYSDSVNNGSETGNLNVINTENDNLLAYRTQSGVIKFTGSGEGGGLIYLNDGDSTGAIHSDDGTDSSSPSVNSEYSIKLGDLSNDISDSNFSSISGGSNNAIYHSEHSAVIGDSNHIKTSDNLVNPNVTTNTISGGKLNSITDSSMGNVSGYLNGINSYDNASVSGGRNNTIGYVFTVNNIDEVNNRIYIRDSDVLNIPWSTGDVGVADITVRNYLTESSILDKEFSIRGDLGDYNVPSTFYVKSVDPDGFYITISTTQGGSTFDISGTDQYLEMIIEPLETTASLIRSSSYINGGYDNNIKDSWHTTINGGFANTMYSAQSSSITGGASNVITSTTYGDILGGEYNTIDGGATATIINGLNNRIEGISAGGAVSVGVNTTIVNGKHNLISTTGSASIFGSQYSKIIDNDNISDYNTIIGATSSLITGKDIELEYTADTTANSESGITRGEFRWQVPANQDQSGKLYVSGFRGQVGTESYNDYYGNHIDHILSTGRTITITDGIETQEWNVNNVESQSLFQRGPSRDSEYYILDVSLMSYSGPISNGADITFTIPVIEGWAANNIILGGSRNTIMGGVSSSIVSGMDNTLSTTLYTSNMLMFGRNNSFDSFGNNSFIGGEGNRISGGSNNFTNFMFGRENTTYGSMEGGNVVVGTQHLVYSITNASSILSGKQNALGSTDLGLIVGGLRNFIEFKTGAIIYGDYNTIDGTNSRGMIIGGINNNITGFTDQITVVNGKHNRLYWATSSLIGNGNQNKIGYNGYGAVVSYATISNGNSNTVLSNYSTIHNGAFNSVTDSLYSDIGNGYSNLVVSKNDQELNVDSYNDNIGLDRIEVTSTSHGLTTGDYVTFIGEDNQYNTQLEYEGSITVVDSDNFYFSRVDYATSYDVYITPGMTKVGNTITLIINQNLSDFNIGDNLDLSLGFLEVTIDSIEIILEDSNLTVLTCTRTSGSLSDGVYNECTLINTTIPSNPEYDIITSNDAYAMIKDGNDITLKLDSHLTSFNVNDSLSLSRGGLTVNLDSVSLTTAVNPDTGAIHNITELSCTLTVGSLDDGWYRSTNITNNTSSNNGATTLRLNVSGKTVDSYNDNISLNRVEVTQLGHGLVDGDSIWFTALSGFNTYMTYMGEISKLDDDVFYFSRLDVPYIASDMVKENAKITLSVFDHISTFNTNDILDLNVNGEDLTVQVEVVNLETNFYGSDVIDAAANYDHYIGIDDGNGTFNMSSREFNVTTIICNIVSGFVEDASYRNVKVINNTTPNNGANSLQIKTDISTLSSVVNGKLSEVINSHASIISGDKSIISDSSGSSIVGTNSRIESVDDSSILGRNNIISEYNYLSVPSPTRINSKGNVASAYGSAIVDSSMSNLGGYANIIHGGENTSILSGRENSIGNAFYISDVSAVSNTLTLTSTSETIRNYSEIVNSEFRIIGNNGAYNLPETVFILTETDGTVTISLTQGGPEFDIIYNGQINEQEMFLHAVSKNVGSSSSSIVSGYHNKITGNVSHAVIVGGRDNAIGTYTDSATILSGTKNFIQFSPLSTIIGGQRNIIDNSSESIILLADNSYINSIAGGHALIGSGKDHRIDDSYTSTILNGTSNSIYGFTAISVHNQVLNGRNNSIGEAVMSFTDYKSDINSTTTDDFANKVRWNDTTQINSSELYLNIDILNDSDLVDSIISGSSKIRFIREADNNDFQEWVIDSINLVYTRPYDEPSKISYYVTFDSGTYEFIDGEYMDIELDVDGTGSNEVLFTKYQVDTHSINNGVFNVEKFAPDIRWNNATQVNSTEIYINVDITDDYKLKDGVMNNASKLKIISQSNVNNFQLWNITNVDYDRNDPSIVTYDVSLNSGSYEFSDSEDIDVELDGAFSGYAGGSNTIVNGYDNFIYGNTVGNTISGRNNTVRGDTSSGFNFINGTKNKMYVTQGSNNFINGEDIVITNVGIITNSTFLGRGHRVYGTGSIFAGNTLSILSGLNNTLEGVTFNSFIVGGRENHINNGNNSFIVGGFNNYVNSLTYPSFVIGGYDNVVDVSPTSMVVSGINNEINDSMITTIISGTDNTVSRAISSTIIGGAFNAIDSNTSGDNAFTNYSLSNGYSNSNLGAHNSTMINGAYNSLKNTFMANIDGLRNKVEGNYDYVFSSFNINIDDLVISETVHGLTTDSFIKLYIPTSTIEYYGKVDTVVDVNTFSIKKSDLYEVGDLTVSGASADLYVLGNYNSHQSISDTITMYNVDGNGTEYTFTITSVTDVRLYNGPNKNEDTEGSAPGVVHGYEGTEYTHIQLTVVSGPSDGTYSNSRFRNTTVDLVDGNVTYYKDITSHSFISDSSIDSVIKDGIANTILSASKTIDNTGSANRPTTNGFTEIINSSNSLTVGAGNSIFNSNASSILGGTNHYIRASKSSIVGGDKNSINDSCELSTISGGFENALIGGSTHSFIGGGSQTVINGSLFSSIVGGGQCQITGVSTTFAFIGGGQSNTINDISMWSVIVGGTGNTINTSSPVAPAQKSFIGGGQNNTIESDLSTIIGGENNMISSLYDNVHIIGSGIDISSLNHSAGSSTYMEALVVGNPTGTHNGNGSISAQSVYDDNVLLTDYVFEKYYDGEVIDEDRQDYTMKSLSEEIVFTEEKKHLSTMIGREEWEENGSSSTGEIISQLWETVETQFLYIKELKEEIDKLKGAQ
jgi:hypothetical protein